MPRKRTRPRAARRAKHLDRETRRALARAMFPGVYRIAKKYGYDWP